MKVETITFKPYTGAKRCGFIGCRKKATISRKFTHTQELPVCAKHAYECATVNIFNHVTQLSRGYAKECVITFIKH